MKSVCFLPRSLRIGGARVLVGVAAILVAASAQAGVVFQQDFESGTGGWSDGGVYGSITRVASGTNGVTSAGGSFHANVTGDPEPSGPYSFFDGARSTWPGEWTASLDIYLDTNWGLGEGF